MKDNRCFICKFNELNTPKVYDDRIYDDKGDSMVLPLCHGHSVDLFKLGQVTFLMKHKSIFSGKLGWESDIDWINFFPMSERRNSFF